LAKGKDGIELTLVPEQGGFESSDRPSFSFFYCSSKARDKEQCVYKRILPKQQTPVNQTPTQLKMVLGTYTKRKKFREKKSEFFCLKPKTKSFSKNLQQKRGLKGRSLVSGLATREGKNRWKIFWFPPLGGEGKGVKKRIQNTNRR